LPADFDIDEHRDRAPWQIGDTAGSARIRVAGDTAWWVDRAFAGPRSRIEGEVFVTEYSSIPLLASWILRQDGRAVPLEPDELRRELVESLERVRARHDAPAPPLGPDAALAEPEGAPERPAGPVAPERFGVLQALLAYLLDACGEAREAVVSATELVERFGIPPDQLEDHLSLLNLVNFGGGCYTVYAQLDGDSVHVDKELYGDAFRAPPKLTPLEARAIRLALEFVGPMIAAEANEPLERVRRRLEETFGQFELAQTPEPHEGTEEERLVTTFTEAIRERRVVEIEYLKEGEEEATTRLVETYVLERELPNWRVHTWDRSRNGERSFRIDRMRSARMLAERFQPREGFEPRALQDARRVRIWYSSEIARWQVERGARLLADGSAVADTVAGSDEWLTGEILSFRGEAVLLEPEELRPRIAARAAELTRELAAAAAVGVA
jgi:proteasome accessory factor C